VELAAVPHRARWVIRITSSMHSARRSWYSADTTHVWPIAFFEYLPLVPTTHGSGPTRHRLPGITTLSSPPPGYGFSGAGLPMLIIDMCRHCGIDS